MSSPEFVPHLHAAERFHFGGSRTVDRVRSSFWSHSARVAVFWALCDMFCVLVATTAAIRIYLGNFTSDESVFQTQSMLSASPWLSLFYLCWFMLSLILVSRRLHLYAPIQLRNTLHDQRLTIQACFTAGLLLSGALYLGRGQEISRGVVILTIAFTAMLLSTRRLIWRAIVYRRYDRGIETRNILIIGTGRIGQALSHHIDSIRHLGYTFKGYIHVPGHEPEARRTRMCWGRLMKFLNSRANTLWTRFLLRVRVSAAWLSTLWSRPGKRASIFVSCPIFTMAWRGTARLNTSASFRPFRYIAAKYRMSLASY